ncbi:MAG: TldD/PmbA family protein, partial [Bradymonadia bacterium]
MQHFDEVVQATLDDVPPVSYTTSVSDGWGSYYRLFSTGFSEASQTSTFAKSGTISLKDKDGKLPLGWDGTYARHLNDLLADDRLARTMLERAQHQLGARPIDTGRYDIIIVNRGMGKVLGPLLNPLRGSSIQQGRSLWKDRLNDQIVSKHLTIWDEPHRIRGLGSSQFDGDGFETCRRPLIENGRLKTFLINDYYARKLNCERTGADTHSLEWTLGSKDLSGLVGEVHNGLLIERFLGGNCNETTGNFSFGCAGRRIENGIITTPFAEANLSGQLETFWKSLRQIGNDPLEQSSNGAPSCLFAGAQVSGN